MRERCRIRAEGARFEREARDVGAKREIWERGAIGARLGQKALFLSEHDARSLGGSTRFGQEA